jgi:hypothetical protein
MQKVSDSSGKIIQKISGFVYAYISEEQVRITHVEALPRQWLHVIVCGKVIYKLAVVRIRRTMEGPQLYFDDGNRIE